MPEISIGPIQTSGQPESPKINWKKVLIEVVVVVFIGSTFTQIFSFFNKPTQPSSATLGQTSQLATNAFGSYIGTGTLGFEEDLGPGKYNLNYAAGYVLRQQWAKIEPEDNVYNWSYLDNALFELKAAGKKGTIRIVAGPNSPDWLRTQYNIKTVCWQQEGGRSPSLNCFPWMTDAKYQSERKEMLQALYNHYKNNRPDLETAISFVSFPAPKQAESAEVSYVRNPNWTIYLNSNSSSGIPIGIYCVANNPDFSYCPSTASLPVSTFANEGYTDASLYQQLRNSILDAYSAMPTWYIGIMHAGGNAISPKALVQNNYKTILDNNLEDRVMIGFTGLVRLANLSPETKDIYDDVKTNFYQASGGKAKIGWQPDGSTLTSDLYEAWCELAAPMSSKWLEASGTRWPSSDLDQIFLNPDCGNSPPSSPPTPTSTEETQLSLIIGLDGTGNTGDNASPNDSSGSNKNPRRTSRNITVQIFDGSNTLVSTSNGTVTYNSSQGLFIGNASIGSPFETDNYIVKIKSDGYLIRQVAEITTITAGETTNLPRINLVTGNINSIINNDNAINILDYNILISCSVFSTDNQGLCNSNSQYRMLSDLDDNGVVNQFDYNLFLREYSVQNGD